MDGDTAAFRRGLLHLLNALLLTVLAGLVLAAWDRLPERIPTHFGAGGIPDGWTQKGSAAALLLVGMPALVTGLLYGSRLLVGIGRRWPRLMNIPRKREFLALPPSRQQPYWDLINEMLAASGVGINTLFLSTTGGILSVATGGSDRLNEMTVFVPIGLLIGVMLVYTLMLMKMPGDIIRQHGHGIR